MSFFDRATSMKRQLHFQEMHPILSPEGFKEVQTKNGSLTYTHRWMYSLDGTRIRGIETISCSNSTHSGERWELTYKGKIFDEFAQDRQAMQQIYSYRNSFLNAARYLESLQSPPKIPGVYDPEAEYNENIKMEVRRRGWPRNFNGFEFITLNQKPAFRLFFGGGIKI